MATTKKVLVAKAPSRKKALSAGVETKDTKHSKSVSLERSILDAIHKLGSGKRIRPPIGAKPEIKLIFEELARLDQHMQSVERQRNERRANVTEILAALYQGLPPVTQALKKLIQTKEWIAATNIDANDANDANDSKNDGPDAWALMQAMAQRAEKLSIATRTLFESHQNPLKQSASLDSTIEEAILLLENLQLRLEGLERAVESYNAIGRQLEIASQDALTQAEKTESVGPVFRVLAIKLLEIGGRFRRIAEEVAEILGNMRSDISPLPKLLQGSRVPFAELHREFDQVERKVQAFATAQENTAPILLAFAGVQPIRDQSFRLFLESGLHILLSTRKMIEAIARRIPSSDELQNHVEEMQRMSGPASATELFQKEVSNLTDEIESLREQARDDRETIARMRKVLELQSRSLRQHGKTKRSATLLELTQPIIDAVKEAHDGLPILPPENAGPEFVEIFEALNAASDRLVVMKRNERQWTTDQEAILSPLQQNIPIMAIAATRLSQVLSAGALDVRREYAARKIDVDVHAAVKVFAAVAAHANDQALNGVDAAEKFKHTEEISQDLQSRQFVFPYRMQAIHQLLGSMTDIFADVAILANQAAIFAAQARNSEPDWHPFTAALEELVQRKSVVTDVLDLVVTITAEIKNLQGISERHRSLVARTLATLEQIEPSAQQVREMADEIENSALELVQHMFDETNPMLDPTAELAEAVHRLAGAMVKHDAEGRIENALQEMETYWPQMSLQQRKPK